MFEIAATLFIVVFVGIGFLAAFMSTTSHFTNNGKRGGK